MNTPVNTKLTAWCIDKFLSLFEFRSLAVYAADETPYGIVMMKGNPIVAIQGISTMVRIIADNTGKSEQEIIRMIVRTRPKEI